MMYRVPGTVRTCLFFAVLILASCAGRNRGTEDQDAISEGPPLPAAAESPVPLPSAAAESPVPPPAAAESPVPPPSAAAESPVPPPSAAAESPVPPPSAAAESPVPPPAAAESPVPPPSAAAESPVPPPSAAAESPVPPPSAAAESPVPPPSAAAESPVPPPSAAAESPVPPPSAAAESPVPPPAAAAESPVPPPSAAAESPVPPPAAAPEESSVPPAPGDEYQNPLIAPDGPSAEAEAPGSAPSAGEQNTPDALSDLPAPVKSDIADSDPFAASPDATPPASGGASDSAALTPGQSQTMESPGEITITLPGRGWGFRSDLSTPGSWQFLDREWDGKSTKFRFFFGEQGNWNLVFDRQDLSTGESEQDVRRIEVGENGGSDMSGSESSAIQGQEDQMDEADKRDEQAREALAAGDLEKAMEFWKTDAGRDDESGRRARAELMDTAARQGDVSGVTRYLPAYLSDGGNGDTLNSLLGILENQDGYAKEKRSILEALSDPERESQNPEWVLKLAQRLEVPGDERDLDRAVELYTRVGREWPLSEWADQARERLAWLNRYYFRIR